jgi:hypothetical protein
VLADPSRGTLVFKPHENTSSPATSLVNARTGAVVFSNASCGCDNGRGVADDVYAGNAGIEFWSAAVDGLWSAGGSNVGRKPGSINFLAWWDGDPVRELLDGTHVDKYGTGGDTRLLTGSGVGSNNGTKSTPAISGDLFGDWREEVVWRYQRQPGAAHLQHADPDRPAASHAAARPDVPGGARVAEHRVQPAAAPELLHRQRYGRPTAAQRLPPLTHPRPPRRSRKTRRAARPIRPRVFLDRRGGGDRVRTSRTLVDGV